MSIVLDFLKKRVPIAVKKFRAENDVMITYKELKTIPINVPIPIEKDNPNAGEYIRIPSPNKDSLMFTVTMMAGHFWQLHHHDCRETCLVFKGHLKDHITKQKAGAAQVLTFEGYQPHYVEAKSDSIFYVEFMKP